MSKNYDLVRFSQKALPIAKQYDNDGNKALDANEYKDFMSIWTKKYGSESPLLMQLHMTTLTDEAKKIAEECDTDKNKGVLTELEIQRFMDKCDLLKLNNIFKNGVDVYEVLTGKKQNNELQSTKLNENDDKFSNRLGVKWALFNNWLKLDIMNYKGTDKFFHAVGNFEAMLEGSEEEVKKVCAGQDQDKRTDMQRSEEDYTEDLYANWLGREFAKMYSNKNPHELFRALAPTGFNTTKAKSNVMELAFEQSSEGDNWFSKKFKQYKNYFSEDFIQRRIKSEFQDLIAKN